MLCATSRHPYTGRSRECLTPLSCNAAVRVQSCCIMADPGNFEAVAAAFVISDLINLHFMRREVKRSALPKDVSDMNHDERQQKPLISTVIRQWLPQPFFFKDLDHHMFADVSKVFRSLTSQTVVMMQGDNVPDNTLYAVVVCSGGRGGFLCCGIHTYLASRWPVKTCSWRAVFASGYRSQPPQREQKNIHNLFDILPLFRAFLKFVRTKSMFTVVTTPFGKYHSSGTWAMLRNEMTIDLLSADFGYKTILTKIYIIVSLFLPPATAHQPPLSQKVHSAPTRKTTHRGDLKDKI